MVVAKKYVVLCRFEGEPKKSDFKIEEEELPPLQENGKNNQQLGIIIITSTYDKLNFSYKLQSSITVVVKF